jgi:hypothetical protein
MDSGFITRDSGVREEFKTGSRRDTREGKGRFDLIPPGPLRRLAQLYERGAQKYGDHNWQKGQPLSRYLDSAYRHLVAVAEGQEDEDHLAAVAWNAFSLMWTQAKIREGKLPPDLYDLPGAEDSSVATKKRIRVDLHAPSTANPYERIADEMEPISDDQLRARFDAARKAARQWPPQGAYFDEPQDGRVKGAEGSLHE